MVIYFGGSAHRTPDGDVLEVFITAVGPELVEFSTCESVYGLNRYGLVKGNRRQ